jgi:hypothetical protein
MATTPQRTALAPHVAATGPAAVTFEIMERMAHSIAKSGLFGIKTPDQALALMLVAQAEGRPAALVARDYSIIQGRPSKTAEAMLRDFQAAGGKVEWHELTDAKVDATFSHPLGGTARIDWDMARAKQAGLAGKDGGMYQKYPRAMLRSRVVSEGVRTVWPGATSGMYTPEEAHDIPEIRDVTPQRENEAVQAAVDTHTALTAEERAEHLKAIKESKDQAGLASAFAAAWKHGSEAKDQNARTEFKSAYEARKSELTPSSTEAAS